MRFHTTTRALCAGLLFTACVIGNPDDDTTTSPTNTDSTVGTTVATDPGGTTADPTDGGGDLGCGWYAAEKYYACAPDGAPGVEDPDGIDPLACADPGALMSGGACDDASGPVNGIGCCNGDVLYFCDNGAIVEEDCSQASPGTTGDTGDTADTGETTVDPTSEPTGGGVGCGWNDAMMFYSCAPDGMPGVEDPSGNAPLACADPGTIMEGAACDGSMGPVTFAGCCDTDVLYFCGDTNTIVKEDCAGG